MSVSRKECGKPAEPSGLVAGGLKEDKDNKCDLGWHESGFVFFLNLW